MENFSKLGLNIARKNLLETSIHRRWASKDKDKEKLTKICKERKRPPMVFNHLPNLDDRGMYGVDALEPKKKFESPRVIIIGAGMAGLCAAARLSEHKMNNYVVLEALERPGGRIHSCWLGDTTAELGAPWKIDKAYRNPLWEFLAKEYFPKPGPPATLNTRQLFNRIPTGNMRNPPTFKAYYIFKKIEEEADNIFCHGGNKQHGSMINFIAIRIQQELYNFPEDQQHDALRIMFGLLQMILTRGNTDKMQINCDTDGCFIRFPGSHVQVPLGLSGIFAPIMRMIEGTIRYCKPVHCIYWGTCVKSGHRAIVTCCDGDEFPADYVIITVPLGVLQVCHDKMFCPALSGAKVSAINSLCCGCCNKVFLEYYRPFWSWQTCNLNLKLCGGSGSCGWAGGITATEIVHESKCVLGVWVCGPGAVQMEGLCDKDVAEGVTRTLRSVTGADIPYPCCVLRSTWSSDPYFRCAYSVDQRGDGCAQRELGKAIPESDYPMPPILMFAGEHTVPGLSATVAAARISGIREAERVMELTRLFKGPPLPPKGEWSARGVKEKDGDEDEDKKDKAKAKG